MKSIEPYSNENKKHVDTVLCDIENVSNDQAHLYSFTHTHTPTQREFDGEKKRKNDFVFDVLFFRRTNGKNREIKKEIDKEERKKTRERELN